MKIRTITENRKELVKVMGELLEVKPSYLGMPSAGYEIDCFLVDRESRITWREDTPCEKITNLLEQLVQRGLAEEEKEEMVEEHIAVTIEFPREGFSEESLHNLQNLVDAKGNLIKKALGIRELPLVITAERVGFPWFEETPVDGERFHAYSHLISSLCELARKQKRVQAKEKEVTNEKYAFRCFLLRLGFIGSDYKKERKILLENLSGSSAFKEKGASL